MVDIVNGPASKDTMYNYRTCSPGYCLATVWQAYKDNGAHVNGSYPTAWEGWLASDGKHEGDWNPPVGVAVWLGQRSGHNGECGDVMISNGNGTCVATDWPYNGVINICSIQDRLNQTGRPYMGWTETILDFPIDYPGRVQPEPPKPPPNLGGNMFLIHNASNPTQLVLVTVDAGQIRAYYLEDAYERAVFSSMYPQLPVTPCDDPTFDGFLARVGYTYGAPVPLMDVNAANITLSRREERPPLVREHRRAYGTPKDYPADNDPGVNEDDEQKGRFNR